MKLSVLIFDTAESYDLNSLFEMAESAEKFGYSRFWLGEHFDHKGLWNNPEPLMPVILGLTEKIKVGCAGIILKLHAPLRVASSFRLMNTMYPDRVDLGLAGGYTTDQAGKLLTGKSISEIQQIDFYPLVEQLCSFYTEETKYLNQNVYVNPIYFSKPNLWLLSLGFNRFEQALKYELNYSKSIFHSHANNLGAIEELNIFKEAFYAKYDRLPEINISFAGIVTQSEKETIQEKAKAANYTNTNYLPNIIGTPDQFREKINEYRELYNVDDFAFLDMSPNMERRIENLELLSEVCELQKYIIV